MRDRTSRTGGRRAGRAAAQTWRDSGAALVLAHGAEHRAREPLTGAGVRDRAHVYGEHLPARRLDTIDDLALHLQRAHEPVEVRYDDHVRIAGLDRLDGAAQLVAMFKRRPTAHVGLVLDAEKRQPVVFARDFDALALLRR
jgi:hypothetical protein